MATANRRKRVAAGKRKARKRRKTGRKGRARKTSTKRRVGGRRVATRKARKGPRRARNILVNNRYVQGMQTAIDKRAHKVGKRARAAGLKGLYRFQRRPGPVLAASLLGGAAAYGGYRYYKARKARIAAASQAAGAGGATAG